MSRPVIQIFSMLNDDFAVLLMPPRFGRLFIQLPLDQSEQEPLILLTEGQVKNGPRRITFLTSPPLKHLHIECSEAD